MKDLFPKLPADLSAATDDELATLKTEHAEIVAKIRAQDPDTFEGREATEIVEQLRAGVDQFKQIEAEQADRAEAQKNFADEVAELTAGVETFNADSGDSDATDEAADDATETADDTATETADDDTADEATAETEETVDAEAVVAAAEPKRLALPPRTKAAHKPKPAENKGAAMVAAAGINGFAPGEPVTRERLADLVTQANRSITVRPGGVAERVIIASAQYDYPEERRLDRDGSANMEKIRAVTSPQALVAAGGLCAPLAPIYDLPILSDADRPVRAALASFQADRGGITYPTPIGLSTARGAITRVTAEQDEAGGSSATKACLEIDCDAFQEATVDAIAACVTWSNLGARAWPERVDNITELVQVAHAENAEIGLLDGLSDGSTQVTGAAEYGATASLLRHMLLAAAGYRSRNRMRPDRVLRAILPSYTVDMLVADIVSGQYERFSRDQAGVEALLRSYRIAPSFYMDGESGGGQVFSAQTAGTLNDWPSDVKWFLFAEGTWLFLDMGRIDLGVVRDSVLNAQNQFQVFYETFEGIAKVGVESLEITSTVCPNGATAAPATALTC